MKSTTDMPKRSLSPSGPAAARDLSMPRSKGMVIGFWIVTTLFCLRGIVHTSGGPLVAARGVQIYGGCDESLQGLLVDLVALVEVDGTPCITLETRVEEA